MGVHDAWLERQVLAWLQPTRPEHFMPDTFPVFNLEVEEGRYYGFPSFLVPGFKLGRYGHLGEQVGPRDRRRHVGAAEHGGRAQWRQRR